MTKRRNGRFGSLPFQSLSFFAMVAIALIVVAGQILISCSSLLFVVVVVVGFVVQSVVSRLLMVAPDDPFTLTRLVHLPYLFTSQPTAPQFSITTFFHSLSLSLSLSQSSVLIAFVNLRFLKQFAPFTPSLSFSISFGRNRNL
jgi:hypothetical protein